MLFIFQKRIYREDLTANRHLLYLFGDNDLRVGYGGQAKECRGEPNASGIRTKIAPTMDDTAFMNDADYEKNIKMFNLDIAATNHKFIKGKYQGIVIPSDGFGTGLSDMPNRCPQSYDALNRLLMAQLGVPTLPWTTVKL